MELKLLKSIVKVEYVLMRARRNREECQRREEEKKEEAEILSRKVKNKSKVN